MTSRRNSVQADPKASIHSSRPTTSPDLGLERRLGFWRVEEDSMAPTLPQGSWALFDVRDKGPADGIYAIRWADRRMIRRLAFRPKQWVLSCDNRKYPDPVVSLDEPLTHIEIVGRVLGHLWKLPDS